MFKIGDFSKICQVSVRMLRYYDETGLLKPALVDPFTDYRYYSADQLPRLNRIVALKELGFTVDQIARLLDASLTLEQLRGMLMLRRVEIEQQVQDEQTRLARVEARLKQIELEGKMPSYDVVIKKVLPQKVASVRGVIPGYGPELSGSVFDGLFDEVYAYVYRHGAKAGYATAIYHDDQGRGQDVEVEATAAIEGAIPESERVKVYEFPTVEKMASVVHHGPFATLNQAYQAIMEWTERNGYTFKQCPRASGERFRVPALPGRSAQPVPRGGA
jgi:DNA-binding transcriptional MerR regulator